MSDSFSWHGKAALTVEAPLDWNAQPTRPELRKLASEAIKRAWNYRKHFAPEEYASLSPEERRSFANAAGMLFLSVAAVAEDDPYRRLTIDPATAPEGYEKAVEILSARGLGFVDSIHARFDRESELELYAVCAGPLLRRWIEEKKGQPGSPDTEKQDGSKKEIERHAVADADSQERLGEAENVSAAAVQGKHSPPADDPRYSERMNLNLELSSEFAGVIGELVEEVHRSAKLKRVRTDTKDVTTKALRVVLGNLLRCYQRDPQLYVALSLDAGGYPPGPFNPSGISYRGVARVVGYLASRQQGYVNKWRGQHYPNVGYVTRIRATKRLIDRLATGLPDKSKDALRADQYLNTSQALFSVRALPVIRLKDEKKKLKEDWEPNEETEGMRDRLERYNRYLSIHWIDLLVSDDDFQALMAGEYDDEDEDELAEDPSNENENRSAPDLILQRSLYRVFNNGKFDNGGRFYGGWWQRIPSQFRRTVTINWIPVVELDFSNMQPAMLYAREGLTLDRDAYAIEGVDEQHRKLIKKTLFKLINATGRIARPSKDKLPKGWSWQQLLDAVAAVHKPIEKYFHSGIGIELQRIDSDIADYVMTMMMNRDKLVLPVHDSFLVQSGLQEQLKEVMAEAYAKKLKGEIGIKSELSFFEVEGVTSREREMIDAGVYGLGDALDRFERQAQFAGYRSRKQDFLGRQTETWRWRFYTS